MRENLKNKHRYENVIGYDGNLIHKAERPSNYFSNTFTYNQAEKIKKIFIHLT